MVFRQSQLHFTSTSYIHMNRLPLPVESYRCRIQLIAIHHVIYRQVELLSVSYVPPLFGSSYKTHIPPSFPD